MWQRIIKITFLVLAFLVLYISLARGSLDLMIKDEKENELRKVPIKSEFINKDGVITKVDYKFPETRTLPTSPFYSVKKIRDYLWISFTKNQSDKYRVMMLVADKKMSEVILMNQQEVEKQLLVGTTIEAINQLKLANEGLKKSQLDETEKETILVQINQAKYVYKEIIKTLKINEEEKKFLDTRVEEAY